MRELSLDGDCGQELGESSRNSYSRRSNEVFLKGSKGFSALLNEEMSQPIDNPCTMNIGDISISNSSKQLKDTNNISISRDIWQVQILESLPAVKSSMTCSIGEGLRPGAMKVEPATTRDCNMHQNPKNVLIKDTVVCDFQKAEKYVVSGSKGSDHTLNC